MVELTRRRLLALDGLGAGALGGFLIVQRLRDPGTFGAPPEGAGELDHIADNLVHGGPPPDGIPPIEDPKFVSADEARERNWVWEDQAVDGYMSDEGPTAIPRNINSWHEIVWTSVAGVPAAVTYCPLTGSTLGFRGTTPTGEPLRFGTSGKLYNNNLVMYDRQTESLWPQMLGTAVDGPLKGRSLSRFPIYTTTWDRWVKEHPDTRVLSQRTGYDRDYNETPYEGYGSHERTYFPNAAHWRDSGAGLHPKAEVLALSAEDHHLAVAKPRLREDRVLNEVLGGRPLALFHDKDLDTLRSFDATHEGQRLTFRPAGGGFEDEETGSLWTKRGHATDGELEGERLAPVSNMEAFWFAWYAYHPDTVIRV